VAKIRDSLAVNEQRLLRCHIERLNLKMLNEAEVREKCHVEISNRFAVLEDLDAEMKVNSAWEMIE
jgi:hypothetical protein